MATLPETIVDAGGRDLRVSNPDRVIFPPTERTAPVTKLDIVNYYLAVDDGIMRALDHRPTTLERWPKGVYPGMTLSTREGAGRRRLLPEADPARAPPSTSQTARIAFPSGRHADEVCPTEIAVVGLGGADGHDHLPSLAGPRGGRRPPRRAAPRPRPAAGHRLRGRRARRRRRACAARGARLSAGFPKTSGGRGIHIYVRIEPRWTFTDVRHAAIAFGRELERRAPRPGHDQLVEGGARRADLRRLQPERARPHDRLGLQHPAQAGRAGVGAARTGTRCRDVAPEDFTVATMPARFAEIGDRHAAIDDVALLTAAAARPVRARTLAEGIGRHALPTGLPEDAGRAEAGPALTRSRPTALRSATGCHDVRQLA